MYPNRFVGASMPEKVRAAAALREGSRLKEAHAIMDYCLAGPHQNDLVRGELSYLQFAVHLGGQRQRSRGALTKGRTTK
jgi:hypothetical protein